MPLVNKEEERKKKKNATALKTGTSLKDGLKTGDVNDAVCTFSTDVTEDVSRFLTSRKQGSFLV